MKLACLLTAAGTSSRFGTDKLQLPIDGLPMGVHAMDVLSRIPFALRVLVTSEDKGYLITSAAQRSFDVVINPDPARGMSSSVRLGTEHIVRLDAYDGILYAVADQPHLRAETVDRLVHAFEAEPDYIWAPEADGKRGNPVLFPAALFAELLKVTGDRGGRQVILAHPLLLKTIRVQRTELEDIDTKEDMQPC